MSASESEDVEEEMGGAGVDRMLHGTAFVVLTMLLLAIGYHLRQPIRWVFEPIKDFMGNVSPRGASSPESGFPPSYSATADSLDTTWNSSIQKESGLFKKEGAGTGSNEGSYNPLHEEKVLKVQHERLKKEEIAKEAAKEAILKVVEEVRAEFGNKGSRKDVERKTRDTSSKKG